ncbi:hypothetical protein [uncultured Polaribacter sp.]|uniref:hypothetical protein n=1 Tax=uncultured Polaribacter sp. TaxID=174711 RepID=UPI0026073AF5|nr:hypothetical protein [uncultured Polaribacter sp.]
MKFLKSTLLIFCGLTLLVSCKSEEKKTTVETKKIEVNPITIEKLTDSPAYENAVLRLKEPTNTKNLKEGPLDFKFEVANYELGAQTDSPNASLLANSGKGQHIHFILNNQPYSAHYDPNFTKELPAGVHHLVAFLSRSYHESVKNDNSVVVKKVEVGTNPKDTVGIDAEAPTLIYSRPKGTYSGKDTESLMLDFFVLNTTLSETGNKVKATINGKEFLITEWAPQVIKGLPKGEVTIELELIDAEGNFIDGPFNKVKRTITLKE